MVWRVGGERRGRELGQVWCGGYGLSGRTEAEEIDRESAQRKRTAKAHGNTRTAYKHARRKLPHTHTQTTHLCAAPELDKITPRLSLVDAVLSDEGDVLGLRAQAVDGRVVPHGDVDVVRAGQEEQCHSPCSVQIRTLPLVDGLDGGVGVGRAWAEDVHRARP